MCSITPLLGRAAGSGGQSRYGHRYPAVIACISTKLFATQPGSGGDLPACPAPVISYLLGRLDIANGKSLWCK